MYEDHHLVLSPLLLPPGLVPVVHPISPAVASSNEARHLGDDLGLLLQQGHVVGEEDDLLVLNDLVSYVFDQHDGNERLAAASAEVHDGVVLLGLLQQLHLKINIVRASFDPLLNT